MRRTLMPAYIQARQRGEHILGVLSLFYPLFYTGSDSWNYKHLIRQFFHICLTMLTDPFKQVLTA